ncbi:MULTISPECIES: peptidoglycan DD-metalloendopeptidase family protein [unclassified Sphingomonas]|uniref:murein hydrolase activator EnvC family protein n=1 Tax=unclassified Sphingomonas TaxID=196159 RepID=UPI002269E295|nr:MULTISPECIES: peptidoglycan DD-metalloendopeptidase family protein [unclassified Sphingomonas]
MDAAISDRKGRSADRPELGSGGRGRLRTAIAAIGAAAALVSAMPIIAQSPLVQEQRRLAIARRDGAAAAARAAVLERQAAGERDAARKARADEEALAARVDAAQADLATASARVAVTDRLLADQRARLGAAQVPIARLLAALESLASRPMIAAVAQPGSVDDLVHVRAVLGSAVPAVRIKTQGVRTELAETRRLQANAALAAQVLRDGHGRLERERAALASLEARHRGRAQALGRSAIGESDRALALGEQARDLVDRLEEEGSAQAAIATLETLPGPLPRPVARGVVPPPRPAGAYRLPVTGRLLTGFDEIADAGYRARGLSFSVAAGAPVVAPAAGRVRYARVFRGYGTILILDHGDGWTSLLTGLSQASVAPGAIVRAGQIVGHAGTGPDPQVGVELRRRGRPMDIAALIG